MNALALSTEVKAFINENLSSYEDLQVLLLMHSHPGRTWDAADIADQLRIEPLSAAAHLMNLHTKGLIGHGAKRSPLYEFTYSPHPEAKERQISALATAFEKARSEVVDYLFRKGRGELSSFAEAFKMTKVK